MKASDLFVRQLEEEGVPRRRRVLGVVHPAFQLGASSPRDRVQPSIRLAALRDELGAHEPVGTQPVEGPIDLGLVSLPDVTSRGVETPRLQVVPRHRLPVEESEYGVL